MKKNLSRREFFQQWTSELTESVFQKIDVNQFLANKEKNNKFAGAQHGWVTVGTIAELSPGTQKKVELQGETILLHADNTGIWATNCKDCTLALRFERPNLIQISQTEIWPKNRVLSHITNEAIDRLITGSSKNLFEEKKYEHG